MTRWTRSRFAIRLSSSRQSRLPRRASLSASRVDLIRFGGRVNYVDLVSSSFVEESLQALGGIRISIRRSLVAAGERPVAI
jgi:hypothetical protein